VQPRPLRRDEIEQVVDAVLDHVEHIVIPDDFRLIGTAAASLRGVDASAGDIDFLARKRHVVDDFAWGLQRYPCLYPPSIEDGSNQFFTRFLVNGVSVEVSTVEVDDAPDGIESYGDGPWRHYSLVSCGDREVPVVALELRLATEMKRGRRDRYEPLLAWMQEHEIDRELLEMALRARGMPEEKVHEFLQTL
jgi:hypothetical protein